MPELLPPREMVTPAISRWSPLKKLVFRFFALYLLLYLTSSLFGFLWHGIVDFLGEHVLRVGYPITVKPNGSGDTTYNYVQLVGIALFATTGSLIWTIIDRRRLNYDKLLYFFFAIVRYYLAFALISYGFAKIYKLQFPFPGPLRLLQPFGDSSPMGLAWTFMGYSTGYNLFTGIAEAAGGFFLLYRRTATFGALLATAVLVNIVAMNFFFDIPVKLYSSHLLLMALFIATPDVPRLISFFFLNKAVPATRAVAMYTKPWMRYMRLVLKTLLLAGIFYKNVIQRYQLQQQYGEGAPKSALYGMYNVESFEQNGLPVEPLITDATRWRTLVVRSGEQLAIKMTNDSIRYYAITTDTTSKKILWSTAKGSIGDFTYATPDKASLHLHGTLDNDSVSIRLHKVDLNKFRLVNRGFHWVNEYPYNW